MLSVLIATLNLLNVNGGNTIEGITSIYIKTKRKIEAI